MHATAKVAHHSAFHWLLGGQAISAVGGQVTFMALPLIATLMFHASPARMGILSALDNLPYLMFGLFVGTMVDRHRQLNVMLASDVVRAVCVATIPVAFLFGLLSFGQLCVVAFVVGIANIFFDVACQAYLPDIVQKDRLVRSNGALQTANGLAALGAPGLVGVFIGTVGAPLSMLVDAVSYACSAGTLLRVRAMVGTGRQAAQASGSIVSSVREGIRAVRKDGRLVGLGGGSTFVALSMGHKDIRGGLMPGGRLRMEKLASLVSAGKLDLHPEVTHVFHGWEHLEEALFLMRDKPADLIKPVVVID